MFGAIRLLCDIIYSVINYNVRWHCAFRELSKTSSDALSLTYKVLCASQKLFTPKVVVYVLNMLHEINALFLSVAFFFLWFITPGRCCCCLAFGSFATYSFSSVRESSRRGRSAIVAGVQLFER